MKLKDLFTIAVAYLRGFFCVRLFKIDDNLYQSGHLTGLLTPWMLRRNKIYHIVDLSGDIDKVHKQCVWFRYWPIWDNGLPDLDELWRVAGEANEMSQLGHNVIVHCSGGCNRSSLVNGCILYLRGYRGRDIVKKIRSGRPGALTNWVFEGYLNALNNDEG